jgi:hypothetical protein
MINAEIDDKNGKITLKGIDNKAKDMSSYRGSLRAEGKQMC